jgi:hypothetical protein
VQWYVIDPDLSNFQTVPSTWQPSIIARGRIGGENEHCFHPTIGVTRQGTAYIEYTYSSATVDPEVRRVRLNSSYTGTVSGSQVVLEPGPALPYVEAENRWADFADMQHAPVLCKLWSAHTLVHDPMIVPLPSSTKKRDIWLFELPYNCFSPDLNANGMVESGDAMLFNDYYAQQDPRADADASGEVDAVDAVSEVIAVCWITRQAHRIQICAAFRRKYA